MGIVYLQDKLSHAVLHDHFQLCAFHFPTNLYWGRLQLGLNFESKWPASFRNYSLEAHHDQKISYQDLVSRNWRNNPLLRYHRVGVEV